VSGQGESRPPGADRRPPGPEGRLPEAEGRPPHPGGRPLDPGEDARRRLEAARTRWERETLPSALARTPERARFETSWGTPIPVLATPADLPGFDYLRELGFPGEYPFTRGVQPTMYRGRLWTMRQYAGFGTAAETNRRFHYLLGQGQTGLSVAFDLPTQMGYDADAPEARSEVGRVGVSISSLADMTELLQGLPLERVSTSMTINATAAILLALYVAVAEAAGVPAARLTGTVQNDILKEFIARGTYIFPPGPSLRLVTDVFAYAKEHVPRWNTISISGYHLREAGCTAVQEVAFTLANAVAYVEAARQAGLEVDEFAPQLSFFFNAHNNLLEEVAKFRAARRLWARLMRERFGARDPRAWALRFHAQTAGSMLTAQQPENNIVRVTVQALAAVLGGCQSLHTNSMDEALALPSEDAVRIALRTQQILAHESGVAETVDPLGGAYHVERLTREVEDAAAAYLDKIEGLGGAVAAIPFMQQEIQDAAYRYQQEVEAQARLVVGVNAFVTGEARPAALFQPDPSAEARQAERLATLRRRRDAARVERALDAVETAARGTANLVPPVLEAVRAQATLGEICGRLRGVFGVHRPSGGF
jgi:methylmalonyl-CoA mutase N-terminal domain/subunit